MGADDSQKATVSLPFPQGAAVTYRPKQAAPARAAEECPDPLMLVDTAATLLLAVLTLPILLASLAWIALVDRGNPLFTQVRIGRHGKPFKIYKIRTMQDDRQGCARFCAHGDERILPGGRLLRRTRIDEIPQLFNVLRGDMALVGPRPEQPDFVATFARAIPRYDERHAVLPGITGLAQIAQGYVDSVNGTRHKLKYDLLFIRKRSLGLWCYVVLGTVRVVLFQRGAR